MKGLLLCLPVVLSTPAFVATARKPEQAGQQESLSRWLPKEDKADIGGAPNAGAEEGMPAAKKKPARKRR